MGRCQRCTESGILYQSVQIFHWNSFHDFYLKVYKNEHLKNISVNSYFLQHLTSLSPQRFVPEVETGHHVQPDVFLAPGRALQTSVNSFPPLVAHAAERAGPLGDVVFEQVNPRVGALSQVGRGHVRHAGCFLVVVGDHVVHVGVRVGELLECLVI